LALAILLIIVLFAGCGGDGGSVSKPTAAPTESGQNPTPTQESSPYNFAAGDYEVNSYGYPTMPYEYELPLSTTDESISFWTVVWTPQNVPEEGFGEMPQAVEQRELTGVNVDYIIVAAANRAENFSVLQASDDFADIMCGATAFTSDTPEKNIEDGYWVNLFDYKEYMPNYMYQSTFDPADDMTYNTVFYKEGMIPAFYALEDTAFVGSNYMARGDWLNELGLSNENIITWDDVHNMLTLFKQNYAEFPFPMFRSIDMAGNYAFNSYDTLPYINPYAVGPQYVVDGKVTFSHMNENDKALMTRLNQWYAEGLIDPGWSGYDNNTAFTDKIVTSQVGYVYMSPGEVAGYENSTADDADAEWVPIHKPLLSADQVVHVGGEKARPFYGSAIISPNCENIPLAVSWLDWRYSPSGSFIVSYGPEGLLWEKDENGKIVATESAINNPDGLAFAWACMLYGLNALAEPGMEVTARKYIIPGGERLAAMHDFWDDYNYDGAYKWPVGAKLTTEQTNEVNTYKADVITYISENYSAFIDGSKPLGDWDSYVEGLRSLGVDRVAEIYQEAYDAYMARQAERN
jgi:putative aldouronate transport system substrate-binding protein